MNQPHHVIIKYLPAFFFSIVLSGCGGQNFIDSNQLLISPAERLAQVELPGQSNEGDMIHLQWTYDELEGTPPGEHGPQNKRTINEVWVEMLPPWRYHISARIEPQGLWLADRGWNGTQTWDYSYGIDPLHAVIKIPEAGDKPSMALDVKSIASSNFHLLEQAQAEGAQLQEIGKEEIEPWGTVRTIAYDWDGSTAATIRYAGYPHTILFKVADERNWLVEWSDIIHADTGDVVHRRYQLTAWEEMDSIQVSNDPWAISLSAGVSLVEKLPESNPVVINDEEPTRTILGQKVKDFGWTPWVPVYLPEGATLSEVIVFPQWESGCYRISYQTGGNPSIVVIQALDLTYGWGNDPEIIELPWATVELGRIDPMGPPGWIALILPHQRGDEQLPNINLLVENPDKELMLKMIESLEPVTQ